MQPIHRYRSLWISDVHLGTPACQAEALLDLLRHTESDYLYLTGDIIDGWQLRKKWFWHQSHNDVVQKILRKARKGTRVIYIPGNHDEVARQFAGLSFGGIAIETEAIHVTARGQRLLVIHGDLFDGAVLHARWLTLLGDTLYHATLVATRWLNSTLARVGLPWWSLAGWLKHRVPAAARHIDTFEHALAQLARLRGLDGVVCGHIHKPGIHQINGIWYCNDGDWVESLTAVAETHEGSLVLLNWQDVLAWRAARQHEDLHTEEQGEQLA